MRNALAIALVLSLAGVAMAGPMDDCPTRVLDLPADAYYRMSAPAAAVGDPLVNSGAGGAGLDGLWGIGGDATTVPMAGAAGPGPFDGYYDLPWNNLCATFDGVNDQMDLGNPAGAEFNQESVTFTLFFKAADDYGNDERLLVNDPTLDNDFKLILAGQNLVVTTSTNGWDTQYEGRTDGINMVDGQWHHIVAIRNGDDCRNVQLFIDGVDYDWTTNVVSSGDSHGTNGGTTARIGSRHVWAQGWGHFGGEIDEVAIWSRPLSYEEVQYLLGVPEPATLSLLALGGGLALIRRKK